MIELSYFDYFALGLGSLVIVGLLTPLMRKLAIKTKFVDSPNFSHKSHATPVPYLGGIAIIVGVLLVVFLAVFSEGTANEINLASSILIPAGLLGLVGLIDDKYNLSPLPRFIAQTIVAIFTAILVVKGNDLGSPTGIESLDGVICVFWIVGIVNAVNFFDNVDGGASGASAIIAMSIFFAALANNQMLLASISIVLGGASLGFLIWNKSPARIYMGDAGALFLGFMLAVLVIRLDPNATQIPISLSVPPLLLAVPILDTSVAVVSRLRRGISPFRGGRDHLSHRLIRAGLSKRSSVFILWALSGAFSFLGVMVASGNWDNIKVPAGALLFWISLLIAFLKTGETDETMNKS